MGELTASIAHEIKQPLTAVVMNGHACIEWLSASPPNLDRVRQSTEKIIQDGTRAGAVLNRIRALFKKETSTKDWLDINEVIQEIMVLVRAEAQKLHIPMRTELAPDLPRVMGDRIQLQQVVLNLMMNGMDAMVAQNNAPKELLVCSWTQSANEIGVRVEDTGVGLDPENVEKIFDPFFTTKADGIGMGLSISRTIIESHDGKLWATPRPGGWYYFSVHDPFKRVKLRMNNPNSVVYIVDDDSSVRDAISNLLESVGLRAQTFGSTEEFMTSSRSEAPSCLVLDVMLPGMRGLGISGDA